MSAAKLDEAMSRLDHLALRVGRSRTDLAAEAIEAYVDVQDWQLRGIEDALASLDAGHWLTHEEIEDWVASIKAPASAPAPR